MHGKRTRAVLSLVVGAGALATEAAVAPTASADTCPAGALCAFTETNWGGTAAPVYQKNANLLQYYNYSHAASLYNNGQDCNVTVWYGTDYSDSSYNLNRGTGWRSLGPNLYHHVGSDQWCLY
jgi:hypothetical protein